MVCRPSLTGPPAIELFCYKRLLQLELSARHKKINCVPRLWHFNKLWPSAFARFTFSISVKTCLKKRMVLSLVGSVVETWDRVLWSPDPRPPGHPHLLFHGSPVASARSFALSGLWFSSVARRCARRGGPRNHQLRTAFLSSNSSIDPWLD